MKKKLIVLAVLVCVIALGAAAVTWASNDVPTVIFDAATKTFTFQNCEKYTYGDEDHDGHDEQYADLFPNLKNLMPGDSAAQSVRVKVINAGSDTVKMYLRAENPNADYDKLLNEEGHMATMTASFGEVGARKTDILRRAADFIRGRKGIRVKETDSNNVYLGAFTGQSKDREVDVSFALPLEAGNEYAGLTATIDWVFLAEIIPDTPGPGPGPGGDDDKPTEEDFKPGEGDIPHSPGYVPRDWLVAMNVRRHVEYVIGRPDGCVHPEDPITRGEAVTIIFRLMTEESRAYYLKDTNTFSDISTNTWCNVAISTLANAGVIQGYPDGTFRQEAPITRAEFVTLLYRIVRARDIAENTFSDVRDNYWAKDAIDNAVTLGIINGYPDGTFRSEETLTRAMMMAICNRMLDRYPDGDWLLEDMIIWPDNMDTGKWYYLDVQEATNTHLHDRRRLADDGKLKVLDWEYWIEVLPNVDWKIYEIPGGLENAYRSDR